MNKKNSIPRMLDVLQSAHFLAVSPGTIRRWAQQKKIKGVKVGSRGDWRFTEQDLTNVLNRYPQEFIPNSEFYQQVANTIPGMVAVYNILTGEYLYVNDAVEKLLGYTAKEFLQGGLPFATSLVHPDDLPRITKKNQAALEKVNKSRSKKSNNVIVNFEYRMRHKNGSWRWLLTEGSVFQRNAAGVVESVLNISVDITARRTTEQHLQEISNTLDRRVRERTQEAQELQKVAMQKERLYRTIIEKSSEAILLMTAEGEILYASPSTKKVFGYPLDFIKYLPNRRALVHPDDKESVRSFFDILRNTKGALKPIRYRIKHGDGTYHWLVSVGTNLLHDKAVSGIVITYRDITERRNAELELEKRLAEQAVVTHLGLKALAGGDTSLLLQEAADRLAEVLSVDFVKILEFLPKERKLLFRAGYGWEPAVVMNKTTLEAGMSSEAGYTLISEQPVIVKDLRTEKRLKNPKFLLRHGVTSCMSCIIYGEDRPFGVIGVHTKEKRDFSIEDINFLQSVANELAMAIERKKNEDEIKASEVRFRALFDSNVIGVCTSNLHGEIIEANDAFLRMLGYTRKELQNGKIRWDILNPPEYGDQDLKALLQLTEKGYAAPFEKEYFRKDGGRIPTIVGSTLFDTDKEISFILDITERKKLEQRKDDFVALASHELKTPITSLKMYTQILQERLKKGEKDGDKFLEKIDGQLDKLTRIVQDLLDVSRLQTGKLEYIKEYFYLDEFISEIVEELQRISYHHKLRLINTEHVKVLADQDRIRQVITNLITNAIRYSPEATVIDISSERSDGSVMVSVKDYGIGIPPEQQQKIFDRFYQVETSSGRTYPGLGLGLFISSDIIARHNGKIWVESETGKGSTFFFTLPLAVKN